MNHHTASLNFAAEVDGNYCSNCGQSSHTHRLSLKHFITHYVIHGVLHLDKGLIFTLKKVMTNLGYAAMEYIAGKRKSYYYFFYLILLLVGFYSLIGKFYGHLFPALQDVDVDNSSAANDFLHNYSKLIFNRICPCNFS